VIEENRQAVLLLTSRFSSKKGVFEPLTPTEYGRFALWLHENNYQPEALLRHFDEITEKWIDPKNKITAERLQYLLDRGLAMSLALEKWQSAGIWTLMRFDTDYPKQLKKHFGQNSPAILYGVGNKSLVSKGGLSIIGSRHIDEGDCGYTEKIAKQAVLEGLNVVSGGAKGVDETAMLAALEIDGTALGILSNDLFRAALSGKWRKHIRQHNLALISPYYPEAGFNTGNAMGRNKYIYCLSSYALAVRSEEGKGGTWSGAKENLKKEWIPLFVKSPSDATGNKALLEMGAQSLDLPSEKIQNNPEAEWLIKKLKSLKTDLNNSAKEPKIIIEQLELF